MSEPTIMRPSKLDQLKDYIKAGARMRMIPAGPAPPQELVVEKKSQMACIFRPDENNPHGRAMIWPGSGAVRFDATGFDKLNSKGEVIVRYEWLDPDDEAPAEAPEAAPD